MQQETKKLKNKNIFESNIANPVRYPSLTRFYRTFNHFHNILRLFDVLPNFPFTTSETMRDYHL